MDSNKRNKLLEKRKSLKEMVRKKELKARIPYQIKYLEDNNLAYSLNYNHEFLLWMQAHFSIRKKDDYYGQHDYQIDIDKLNKNCKTVKYNDSSELQGIFESILLKNYPAHKEIVICKNGGDPELIVSIESLLSNFYLFSSAFEVWFILKDKSLGIEYISGVENLKIFKSNL